LARTDTSTIAALIAATRARLGHRGAPLWALGILVAILAWRLAFQPPAVGADPSWSAGLYMAAEQGRNFGSEIVFGYGPLGFLAQPLLWYSDLAMVAFLYGAAVIFAFSCTAIWTLSRSVGKLGAAIIVFAFLATAPSLEQLPIVLAVAWALATLRDDRPSFALGLLVYGGAVFSALEIMVKLSLGPPILLICVAGLVGARASRRQLLTFTGVFLISMIGLWLLAAQSLPALLDYLTNGEQIVTGYNEAMATKSAPGWEAPLTFLVMIALVAAASFAVKYRDRRARWFGIALVALAAFITFKYGIVRYETNHLAIGFSTALGLWLILPWARARMPVLAIGVVAIGAVTLHSFPSDGYPGLNPIHNLGVLEEQTKILFSSSRRNAVIEQGRVALQSAYRLDSETLAELRGKPVDIDPWEIGVAWAYGLYWSPLPVFQNYSAYTAHLDRLNAQKVADPNGPRIILRENPDGIDPFANSRSIEARYPAWDPPEEARAILCHFAPIHTTSQWQVLERTTDRCGPERLISSVESEVGERVTVPRPGPGEIVFARIHGIEVHGLETLRSLLWRPIFRFAYLSDSINYRLVPGTAAGGLLLASAPALDQPGPYSQFPQATEIRLVGVNGGFRYDFYRMKVRPVPGEARALRPG
jgi:hypothetical protein